MVSADIDRSGATPRAINMMCESGTVIPGTNFSKGGGPAVPCAGAPAVYWGSPNPTWEGAFSSTLTLFKNLQLYANVDFLGGNTLSERRHPRVADVLPQPEGDPRRQRSDSAGLRILDTGVSRA